jgi:putative ABC transport system permease protein
LPLAKRFKEDLAKNPAVAAATVGLYSFSEPGWMNLGYEDEKSVYRNFRMNAIDPDFINTMKLELVAGRNFDAANSADINNAMLVNESLVKEYGWTDAIGKRLPGDYQQQVIGVLKDFHFESLHNKIQPLAMVLQADSMMRHSNDVGFTVAPQPRLTIRLKPGSIPQQIASLEANWKNAAGRQDFDYRFLDESLNIMYRAEERLGSIVRIASVLSIFIACMGLFGLATLVVERRTKEIGIRKVLGADTSGLVKLLSKDFVVLVIIASLLAFPVAWWALNSWLQDFAYRIPIDWWVFILASVAALLIALATVSFQAIKAAMANPVSSLRSE